MVQSTERTMKQTQPLGRRAFLKAGGVTLVALVGGTAWRAVDQGVFSANQDPAYEPWTNWQLEPITSPDGLVKAAILAANPHNTQPWLFRVASGQIDLFADPRRSLGSVDPFLREKYIGLGCAIENLALAARAGGYAPQIELTPDPDDRSYAARITLEPGTVDASPLYDAIPRRHTNRGPYTDRPVPCDKLDALNDTPELVKVIWISDAVRRAQFGEQTYQATEAFIADPEQARDSALWFRTSWQDVQSLRDGITLDVQANPPLMTVAAKMLPPLSQEQNDQYWLKATRTQVDATPAFGIIALPDAQDDTGCMLAGRLYQRMNLWAATQGLATQPLNQLAERADRESSQGIEPRFGSALNELIGDSRWQGVMPFRIGYPTVEVPPSPRRSAEDVLLSR
jgi:hypothetical protein